MSISNRAITLIICFYLLLSPFISIHGYLSPYELPKFIFALVVAQIVTLLFFIKFSKFELNLLNKLIFIYLIIVLTANLFGLDPRTSLIGSVWRYQGFLLLISGIILYFASRYYANKKYIELSIILSGFILSVVTIMEYSLLNYGYYFPTYNSRLVVTMGNPNFLAGYIAIIIPFILYSKLLSKYKYPITIFCVAAVFITQSRSAILATLVIISIYFFQRLPNINIKTITAIGAGVIGFILFFKVLFSMYSTPVENYKLEEYERGSYCLYMLPQNKIGNFIRLFYETHPQFLKRTSLCENRLIIWTEGLKTITNKPLLGYGQENFALVFPKKLEFNVDNSHNFFLETLISSGIIGLISFISILFLGFKKTIFKYKAFLISFLIISFFNPLFISGIILFWITLGLSNNKINST